MKRHRLVWSCLSLLFVAASAAAQPPARPGSQGSPNRAPLTERDRMRLQIAAMEGVLANAVAQIHDQALQAAMPAMFTFEGTRARGFPLEGYGVFFDVDLPPLPRSIVWSVRMLDEPVQIDAEIADLQRQLAAVNDARVRQGLERTIRTIQNKVTRPNVTTRPDGTVVMVQNQDRARGIETQYQDPFKNYAQELGDRLADVLVNYGGTIDLGPNDWLTIAAREMQPRLLPGGPVETAITLRIRASDLAAFKAGRMTQEEARKRVEIKEF